METKNEITEGFVLKSLPQYPNIWVAVPNYKDPILPIPKGQGCGWYGLTAYDLQCDKLLCHECKTPHFFDFLGKHIYHTHKLTTRKYKEKYGLLFKTKLVSNTLHLRRVEDAKVHFANSELRAKMNKNLTHHGMLKVKRTALELLNRHNTCPAQLIRSLIDASKIYGDKISFSEANSFRPGLGEILHKHFISFNKAKQIAKLYTNPPGTDGFKFPKNIILEDMISFYRKNKRWATEKDYLERRMICQASTIFRNGGYIKLRQEAMKLKDEQDKIAEKARNIPLIANNIEMEYAGRARK